MVLFLDADDWLSENALGRLLAAAEIEAADLVHGGCVRVLPDGTQVRERTPPPSEELFATFARTCAFSIQHVHRADRARARRRWVRRIADHVRRLGSVAAGCAHQQLARIPEYIAYYRIRPESASRKPRQILGDGIAVIERGHGDDPRMAKWKGPLHRGERRERRSSAWMYLTTYAAGLCLGQCTDARPLLELVSDGAPGDLDGEAVADTLFHAVVTARASLPEAWSSFPEEINSLLAEFIEALAAKVNDNWLAFTATETLERMIVEYTATSPARRKIGGTELIPLRLGVPVPHLALDPSTRRTVLELRDGDEPLGSVVVPAVDGLLPAAVAADALAEELAWQVLGRFFARSIYPQLTVKRSDERLLVQRGRVILAHVEREPSAPQAEELHEAAGWPIFLQELWGLPGWRPARFYDQQPLTLPERPRRSILAAGGRATVEVSEPLPRIESGDPVAVEVTLAGVPFMALEMDPERGRVEPARLRRAITHLGRFELCRLAVRESLLVGSLATTCRCEGDSGSSRRLEGRTLKRWRERSCPRAIPGS